MTDAICAYILDLLVGDFLYSKLQSFGLLGSYDVFSLCWYHIVLLKSNSQRLRTLLKSEYLANIGKTKT
jgi:hypothetical protein